MDAGRNQTAPAAALLAVGAGFFYLWSIGWGDRCLVSAIPNLVLALWLFWGSMRRRWNSPDDAPG